jgi:hypothetical protein
MYHGDGHDHVAKDSKGRHAGEQPEDKTQSAEEFRGNGQKCECGRDVQDAREEAHRAGESVPTKPSEHLLGAMGEEDYPEHQAENSYGNVVARDHQFANHKILSWKARLPQFGEQ